jgi:hypothetical protein
MQEGSNALSVAADGHVEWKKPSLLLKNILERSRQTGDSERGLGMWPWEPKLV